MDASVKNEIMGLPPSAGGQSSPASLSVDNGSDSPWLEAATSVLAATQQRWDNMPDETLLKNKKKVQRFGGNSVKLN